MDIGHTEIKSQNLTDMRSFHITYYIRTDVQEGILLTGVTLQAENIIEAIKLFDEIYIAGINKIKYVIEV